VWIDGQRFAAVPGWMDGTVVQMLPDDLAVVAEQGIVP
jgi:hypothetical protein